MKKTVFVGKVNDQDFDNVQDYNACVQAMLDMGKEFQDTGFEYGNLTVFLTEKIHEFFLRQGQICTLRCFHRK